MKNNCIYPLKHRIIIIKFISKEKHENYPKNS